ncbi:MAG: nucleoside triphosphate pyrophosphohydrolase [Oscillospiraceae bacterium]|nr:nucleoside triphosphate pyrophosphohydrolase [Oscillospiraceae bacterium]
MINWIKKNHYDVADLVELVALLRSPEGCPWDREQTHESVRREFLEETCEVIEAIDQKDSDHLKEELGDVLLQVVFHTQMEREAGRFQLDDVADGICKKLIYRHPHVFGQVQASSAEQVLDNWDKLKRKEKNQQTHTDALQAVARSLPALWRAEKVQKKAARAGFDWPDAAGPMDKLSEELEELKQAAAQGTNVEEELGDLLFAAVNLSRHIGVDGEMALTAATDKFIRRFAAVENLAAEQGRAMERLSPEELDKLWERAKQQGL